MISQRDMLGAPLTVGKNGIRLLCYAGLLRVVLDELKASHDPFPLKLADRLPKQLVILDQTCWERKKSACSRKLIQAAELMQSSCGDGVARCRLLYKNARFTFLTGLVHVWLKHFVLGFDTAL